MAAEHRKHAATQHPVHPLIASRWSPYVFEPRTVEREKLRACLEAAKWAASGYNEQPWSFFVATRDEEAAFANLLGCLVEVNQVWARNAGALMLSVAATTLSRNGKPNGSAFYDVGLAVANLSLQATELGLAVHQMGGFNRSHARAVLGIPEKFEPVTAIAVGYPGDPTSAAEQDLAERDQTTRQRKPQSEFVFTERWQQAW